jgi:hypothetical protein
VQIHQKRSDIAAEQASAAQGGSGGQRDVTALKETVATLERKLLLAEKEVDAAQKQSDTLTQRQAELDLDIAERSRVLECNDSELVRYILALSFPTLPPPPRIPTRAENGNAVEYALGSHVCGCSARCD